MIKKLQKAMDSVDTTDTRFRLEKIVIDNASLNSSEILESAVERNFKYISEPSIGLSRARNCAFNNANLGLLIFVDDDNYLDTNFITNAYDFWTTHPEVTVFGGRIKSLISPKYKWKKEMLQYLGVRDLGPVEKIVKTSSMWQPEEPIGAGLCLSPELVMALKNMTEIERQVFYSLGRKGKRLISGEDGFICRYLYPKGQVAYVPSLELEHDIQIHRVGLLYLVRLMYNYGVSDYLLSKFLRERLVDLENDIYHYQSRNFIYLLKKLSFPSFLVSIRVLGFLVKEKSDQ